MKEPPVDIMILGARHTTGSSYSKMKCHLVVCSHLFGYCVPVQVALTLVHTLLVQELTLVRNEQGIAHELPNCNMNMPLSVISSSYTHTCNHAHKHGQ